MMSRALLAPASATPQPSVAPIVRTFSDAPTVITFFAVPGEPIVLPPEPVLPAENDLDERLISGNAGLRVTHQRSRTPALSAL